MDDGELFLEYSQSESLALDDGRIKSAAFDTTQGFGLRAVAGEAAGYAHASELSEAAIRRAATTVRAVASGHSGLLGAAAARHQPQPLYRPEPARHRRSRGQDQAFAEIDAYARSRDPRVRAGHGLARAGCGRRCRSSAPTGGGSRISARWSGSTSRSWSATATAWKPARTAPAAASPTTIISIRRTGRRKSTRRLRQALTNLGSVPAPAGEMTVVLGLGLAGGHAARGGRARARRRLQPQEDLGLFRHDRAARRHQGRDGRR